MGTKDITSTSFGLVIAFFLPGIAGLYALQSWSPMLKKVFEKFLAAESDVGLFLIVMLGALGLGLLVTLFRWLIFERLMCRAHRLTTADFAELGDEPTLMAFRAAVDEHYRYHQFWGGMFVVMPFLYIGSIMDDWKTLSTEFIFWTLLCFATVEVVTGIGACASYKLYVNRARRIMKGK